MKKISVLIPCYNEHDNVVPMCEAVEKIFRSDLSHYDYEIVFIDNNSTDGTREIIRNLCSGGGVNEKRFSTLGTSECLTRNIMAC